MSISSSSNVFTGEFSLNSVIRIEGPPLTDNDELELLEDVLHKLKTKENHRFKNEDRKEHTELMLVRQ